MLLMNNILSATIQLILFLSIPFLSWCVKRNQAKIGFSKYIGLYRLNNFNRNDIIIFCLLAILYAIIGINELLTASDYEALANSQFIHAPINIITILSIMIYAFVQTGLSEEIFFRGFLAKQLIQKYGFIIGNLIQSCVFGLIHVLLFLHINDFSILLLIFVTASFIGYTSCWINEKISGGSILPSWLLHSLMNLLSTLLIMVH